jgi:hypothetical protein
MEIEPTRQLRDRFAERDALPAAVRHEEQMGSSIATRGEGSQHAHQGRHADTTADGHVRPSNSAVEK